jgi:UDP-N-acetylmuramyl pentapeptide phosphotransferase/UDP-N-acetylglucosamine-1-phosphate transferase
MAEPDGRARGRTAAAFAAAGAARAAYAGMRRKSPGGAAIWQRRNHSGRVVDLYAGPAVTLGTALAAASATTLPVRTRGAAALAVLAAGACGAYDDVAGRGDGRRGFRAHLGALLQGEITSGAVKLFGVGAAGLAAGALLKERPVDKLLAGAVIAGTAHVVNLLDVRPGRAVKAVLAAGSPGLLRGGAAGVLSAAPIGASAAVLGDDLGERTMLGDSGAHALGAGLGVAIAVGNGRTGLAVHAAAVIAAAALGDAVGNGAPWRELPVLRAWDALGRRPEPASVFSRGATPVRPTGAHGR